MSDVHLSDGTRMALGLAGRCIARDMERAAGVPDAEGFQARAKELGFLLDALDVGDDEQHDADIEALTLGTAELWMTLLRDGIVELAYMEPVLRYYRPQYGVLPKKMQLMLGYIELADADELETMALSQPEYVGFMRAVQETGGRCLDEWAALMEQGAA